MTRLTKLTKEFVQDKKGFPGIAEASFNITVMFDGETVDHIKAVEVYSFDKGTTTNITAVMHEHFEDELNALVDKIDWSEEYLQSQLEEADWLDDKGKHDYYLLETLKALRL